MDSRSYAAVARGGVARRLEVGRCWAEWGAVRGGMTQGGRWMLGGKDRSWLCGLRGMGWGNRVSGFFLVTSWLPDWRRTLSRERLRFLGNVERMKKPAPRPCPLGHGTGFSNF